MEVLTPRQVDAHPQIEHQHPPPQFNLRGVGAVLSAISTIHSIALTFNWLQQDDSKQCLPLCSAHTLSLPSPSLSLPSSSLHPLPAPSSPLPLVSNVSGELGFNLALGYDDRVRRYCGMLPHAHARY